MPEKLPDLHELAPEQRAEIAKVLRQVADRFERPETEGPVYSLIMAAATREGVIGVCSTTPGLPPTISTPFVVTTLHLLGEVIGGAALPSDDASDTENPIVGRVVAGGDA
jgi:hypothetical protein